jgi:hypothetical protein
MNDFVAINEVYATVSFLAFVFARRGAHSFLFFELSFLIRLLLF